MASSEIHPTAIIEHGAEIGAGCRIGPYCHIGGNVRLGPNNVLHAHVVIAGQHLNPGTAVLERANRTQQA